MASRSAACLLCRSKVSPIIQAAIQGSWLHESTRAEEVYRLVGSLLCRKIREHFAKDAREQGDAMTICGWRG